MKNRNYIRTQKALQLDYFKSGLLRAYEWVDQQFYGALTHSNRMNESNSRIPILYMNQLVSYSKRLSVSIDLGLFAYAKSKLLRAVLASLQPRGSYSIRKLCSL